MGTADINIRWM